ncbi:MAG: IS630 family transposase [Chlamydiia bacterium]|nr:IS630 family transposase [Chlamydiia bacterium]
MPSEVTIDTVDIWFQDEARVGQRGTVTRTWAKKGKRPRLKHQQQFEYVYIFGAICPVRDETVGLVMLAVNTEAMLIHLEHISLKIPEGRHAVIVLDRAAWHTTKRLKRFGNISLLPLPPASPELNPTEQVWQVLRDERLANRYYENYEAIMTACCEAWNMFSNIPNRVKKLCSRSWANL